MPAAPFLHVPLAEVTRGQTVESVHYGSVAVVDRAGRVLLAAGDPHAVAFTRSSLKPLQALPFFAAGGVERLGFSQSQAAVMCASHSGEPRHVDAVAGMLARAGVLGTDLQCGTHVPRFYEATGRTPPPPPYSPLQHNCSGKHAGMLAWCTLCAEPTATYLAYDHPLQQAVRHAVATFTGVAEADLQPGIDGCSAPNYAMPLSALARAFARLARPDADPDFGLAPREIAAAMTTHPEMVSGAKRSDLALLEAGGGDFVAKIGAEGVQAIGIRSAGVGIAIKVADGQRRGLMPVIAAVLDQLGLLDSPAREGLRAWQRVDLFNYRGTRIGEVRSTVVLDKRAVA